MLVYMFNFRIELNALMINKAYTYMLNILIKHKAYY